ncbi:MAG: hypothetical protein ACRDUY_03735 [Nitriliruptorales bacterium]
MGRQQQVETRLAYADWLLMGDGERRAGNLPRTDKSFAKLHDTTDRTLRRWRTEDDGFKELLAARREHRERFGVVSPPTTDGRVARKLPEDLADIDAYVDAQANAAGLQGDERDYFVVKTTIVFKARSGDREALNLYMKHWGHEFVEREKAQFESAFPDLSDGEIVAAALEAIGPDRVVEWLTDRQAA